MTPEEEQLQEAKEREEKANQLRDEAEKMLTETTKASQELREQLNKLGGAEEETSEADMPGLEHLGQTLSGIRLSHINKLRQFSKGENFQRFCERFKEYVYITKMKDDNLYVFFLQHVDDETYSILKTVHLEENEKRDTDAFCKLYKKAIYGDEALALKNELLSCQQKEDEDISGYAYRLRDKANVAYDSPQMADENCLIAFLRGIRNSEMRIKLNEASLAAFDDAIKMAKKIEMVGNMLKPKNPEITFQIVTNASL